MQDWASYLDYLQFILQVFDEEGAPEESNIIWFFREDLRPSIKAQIEQQGQEHNSWEKYVKKAIDTEAKTSLQPPSILQKID